MNRYVKRLLSGMTAAVAVLALGAVLLLPSECLACSCAQPPPPQEALARAGAVFAGTVTRVDEVRSLEGLHGWRPAFRLYREAELQVTQAWKGGVTQQVVVRTGSGGGDCGYDFRVGESYLVYAGGTSEVLETGICGRTQRLADAGADLAALGAGKPVSPSASAVGRSALAWVSFGAAAVLLVLAVLLRRARRQR